MHQKFFLLNSTELHWTNFFGMLHKNEKSRHSRSSYYLLSPTDTQNLLMTLARQPLYSYTHVWYWLYSIYRLVSYSPTNTNNPLMSLASKGVTTTNTHMWYWLYSIWRLVSYNPTNTHNPLMNLARYNHYTKHMCGIDYIVFRD